MSVFTEVWINMVECPASPRARRAAVESTNQSSAFSRVGGIAGMKDAVAVFPVRLVALDRISTEDFFSAEVSLWFREIQNEVLRVQVAPGRIDQNVCKWRCCVANIGAFRS